MKEMMEVKVGDFIITYFSERECSWRGEEESVRERQRFRRIMRRARGMQLRLEGNRGTI